jgi:hypothetical protein
MSQAPKEKEPGAMTVAEAGRKGGRKVKERYGHDFYVKIGTQGGQRVRELLAAGRKALEEDLKRRGGK